MNKGELVAAIAAKTGLSKKDSEKAINAFTTEIAEALKKGDKVALVGFGTFEVRERAARVGRNPRDNSPVNIPASKLPVFKAGKGLKESI